MRGALILIIIFVISMVGCNSGQIKNISKSQKIKTKKGIIKEEITNEEKLQEKHLNSIIENLSLQEKLGQMIIVGFNRYEVNPSLRKIIENYKVGVVILFKRNIQNSKQLLALNNSIKIINSNNKLPLFITVDEEGGRIKRYKGYSSSKAFSWPWRY